MASGRGRYGGLIHNGPRRLVSESLWLGIHAMTTIASNSVVVYNPDLIDLEHVALTEFRGGSWGPTCDADTLDVR